ncbi:hypothetical protein D6833_02150 [Candidatus Parcubacteria bacterium]|nr:MAG: hypothetical protein D6833_02150 [Candidatus Parcubacteria bacterium]
MGKKMLFWVVFMTSVAVLGCSGGDSNNNPVGPAPNPPPGFSMASVKVQCNDGSDCIQFFARPDKDVVLVKVVITPPAGDKITFNFGSTTVVANESIGLQNANTAYLRISGEWKFMFTGSLATGDKSSFEVSATISVGA